MIEKNQVPVITVDGPSGTGKGTISHMLAKHLKWNVLDSGLIYRVLAYAVREKSMDIQAKEALLGLAHDLDFVFELGEEEELKVLLEKQDIYPLLRSEQCGQDASQIAAIPEVREALLERQRRFAKPPGLVTDGRDMGTVVFPDAFLKIFLYANAGERANRRYLQLKKKGIDVSLGQVVEELFKRDTRDTARTHAPLKAAEDAAQIDTSGLSVVEVFAMVLELANTRLNPSHDP